MKNVISKEVIDVIDNIAHQLSVKYEITVSSGKNVIIHIEDSDSSKKDAIKSAFNTTVFAPYLLMDYVRCNYNQMKREADGTQKMRYLFTFMIKEKYIIDKTILRKNWFFKFLFLHNIRTEVQYLLFLVACMKDYNIYSKSLKDYMTKKRIEDVKRNFIKYLYVNGYCTKMERHWNRERSEIFNEADPLICFYFKVGDVSFSWHFREAKSYHTEWLKSEDIINTDTLYTRNDYVLNENNINPEYLKLLTNVNDGRKLQMVEWDEQGKFEMFCK